VPNLEGREKILEVHAKGKPIENMEDLKLVAQRTTGMSGADMANVMNEAALMAVRNGHEKITLEDLSEAIDRVAMGPQVKSRILTGKEKRITAYHEGGHALVSHILPSNGQVNKISILPRGQANGLCWTSPTEQRSMYEEGELRDQICMLLAGRAAEELTQSDITTGASNDIERATEIAKGIVMDYGMTDVGIAKMVEPMSREKGHVPGQATQEKIDAEVNKILAEEYNRAKGFINKNMDAFKNMSETLITKEEIDRPELLELLKTVQVEKPVEAPPAPPTPPPAG
jgi:cell division protease FtsH